MDDGVIFSVNRLLFSFDGGTPIVSDLSFELQRDSFIALIGRSGLGKSTLLKLCSGLMEAERGSFRLNGLSVSGSDLYGQVVYMPQFDSLLPWRTVSENVAVSLECARMQKADALASARRFLQSFGMNEYSDRYPWELSGGMRQRIAFLRTLLSSASVLLLDEPFSSLDSLTRKQMHDWLLDIWQSRRRTVMMITHDVDEALLLADQIWVWQTSPCRGFLKVDVPFERPRTKAMIYSDSFNRMKQKLHVLLEGVE